MVECSTEKSPTYNATLENRKVASSKEGRQES